MKNQEVYKYVSTVDPHKNNAGEEYISDLCVKEGYGQTCGGYLAACKNKNVERAEPSQKEHFLDYYADTGEKPPTYYFLRCPQLLLFIAEIAGVHRAKLKRAYETLKTYEDRNHLRGTEKDGNYMWGEQAFRDFKVQICLCDVVRIIRKAKNWDEVKSEVEKL